MAISLFFSWWYGPGWKNSFARINERVKILSSELSLGILLGTLFEPWKQITSYTGPTAPMEVRLRVWFDNIFARCIGFVIRLSVLLFGAVTCLLLYVFGVILAVLWPLIPTAPLLFVILAVVLA